MASSTEEGTPSQEQGQQERDRMAPSPRTFFVKTFRDYQLTFFSSPASLCIAIKNDHNLCSNRAQDGFQTCGIKPHREQDPSEMQGVIGEKGQLRFPGSCYAQSYTQRKRLIFLSVLQMTGLASLRKRTARDARTLLMKAS